MPQEQPEQLCGREIESVYGATGIQEWGPTDVPILQAEAHYRKHLRMLSQADTAVSSLGALTPRQVVWCAQHEDDPPLATPREMIEQQEGQAARDAFAEPETFEIVHDGQVVRIPEWLDEDVVELQERAVSRRRVWRSTGSPFALVLHDPADLTMRQRIFVEQRRDDAADDNTTAPVAAPILGVSNA